MHDRKYEEDFYRKLQAKRKINQQQEAKPEIKTETKRYQPFIAPQAQTSSKSDKRSVSTNSYTTYTPTSRVQHHSSPQTQVNVTSKRENTKKIEPKKQDIKKVEPKKVEPKKELTKREEPKRITPKKEEYKREEPKKEFNQNIVIEPLETQQRAQQIKIEKPKIDEQSPSLIIQSTLDALSEEKKRKTRLELLEKLVPYAEHKKVLRTLIDITSTDPHALCRAKAVAILGDYSHLSDVKDTLLRSLSDMSNKVRLWVVWSLKLQIEDKRVREQLLRHLTTVEKCRKIKMRLIRMLSTKIDDKDVQYSLIRMLNKSLTKPTRYLLVEELCKIYQEPDIIFALSKHVLTETDTKTRKLMVSTLLKTDNSDARYALQKLAKKERKVEIKNLFVGQEHLSL